MHSIRIAVVAVLLFVVAANVHAQPPSAPLPEPLPLGVPYYTKPGNPYWYAPATPVNYPFPFGAAAPVYGRYTWDYTGQHSSGFGKSHQRYPYSYQYPTHPGRIWMGFGW